MGSLLEILWQFFESSQIGFLGLNFSSGFPGLIILEISDFCIPITEKKARKNIRNAPLDSCLSMVKKLLNLQRDTSKSCTFSIANWSWVSSCWFRTNIIPSTSKKQSWATTSSNRINIKLKISNILNNEWKQRSENIKQKNDTTQGWLQVRNEIWLLEILRCFLWLFLNCKFILTMEKHVPKRC